MFFNILADRNQLDKLLQSQHHTIIVLLQSSKRTKGGRCHAVQSEGRTLRSTAAAQLVSTSPTGFGSRGQTRDEARGRAATYVEMLFRRQAHDWSREQVAQRRRVRREGGSVLDRSLWCLIRAHQQTVAKQRENHHTAETLDAHTHTTFILRALQSPASPANKTFGEQRYTARAR